MKYPIGATVRSVSPTCLPGRTGRVVDVVEYAPTPYQVQIPGEHPVWFGADELEAVKEDE